MPRIEYSLPEHMAQLGRVTALFEAQSGIQKQIIKEQKKLKIIEQRQLIEKIKHIFFLIFLLCLHRFFLSFITHLMVGVDGLEPSRCFHQWFLRPPCLPIPAHAPCF